MNPQDNIAAVNNAMNRVKEHCMCFSFTETETHFRVIYPDGYFPDGVQVSKSLGKANALVRLFDAMERHWKASFPQ